MRFVEQRNDWDLVIPFKEDCFDSKLHNGTKFEKLTHRFLFAFQDSGDCESVPSYCFASSKDLTKVYYPLKYNELVVAYLEIGVSDSGVVSFTIREFIDCLLSRLNDIDLAQNIIDALRQNYNGIDKDSICFSCHLFLKGKKSCHYVQEFPSLVGHIAKLHVYDKAYGTSDMVRFAKKDGKVHIVGISANYLTGEANPLIKLDFEDLGLYDEWEEEYGSLGSDLLTEALDVYTDGMLAYDSIGSLNLIIDNNAFYYGDLLDFISIKVLNEIAPAGWTFIKEVK